MSPTALTLLAMCSELAFLKGDFYPNARYLLEQDIKRCAAQLIDTTPP